ncbi:hemolysin family protein [soil metagenome]
MGGVWTQLALVAALVVINAALAGSEIALVSLREGQLQRLKGRGAGGRALVRLAEDPNRFLAAIQIGITLAGFLASATAAVSLAQPLVSPLELFGGAAEPVAIVIVTLVLSFITLVFGELAPKRIAMQRPEGWGLVAARPLAAFAVVTRPIIWVLGKSTDVAVRLVGADPAEQREEVSQEELRDMVASQATFSPHHRTIISEAFDIAERTLREVVVPRRQVITLEGGASVEEALVRLARSGHSRAPVVGRDLDDIIGIVHLRDLVHGKGTVGEVAQPAILLPETLTALDALRRLQAERQQIAAVVNEHGGVEGIVTLEDLLEEIVGDIYDETDRDVVSVQHEPDGSMVLAGSFPWHDLEDIGVGLPQGGYTTVAGFILEQLGRIPAAGEVIEVNDWRVEIIEATERAILRLRLTPVPPRSI